MNVSLARTAAALALVAGSLLAGACSQQPEAAATTGTPAAALTDSTTAVAAAYICPMGCEGSASDKPGKCPVCEMALEPNPAAKPAVQ